MSQQSNCARVLPITSDAPSTEARHRLLDRRLSKGSQHLIHLPHHPDWLSASFQASSIHSSTHRARNAFFSTRSHHPTAPRLGPLCAPWLTAAQALEQRDANDG